MENQFTPTQPGLHTAEVVTPDQNKETPFDVSAPQVETGKPALVPPRISQFQYLPKPKESPIVTDPEGNILTATLNGGKKKLNFVPHNLILIKYLLFTLPLEIRYSMPLQLQNLKNLHQELTHFHSHHFCCHW
eukprot:TRINITY_DN3341_c0_g1_i5.p1 TRINITY_DN3341_c0_g1~~TRINITY_DN3341_c0_g1_i5.p1  ORF type:complete len:133 (-),score=31.78 TRINITY_DN3341_c0_g1_i5:64-462(-)